MTTNDIDLIISEVNKLRSPKEAMLKITGGVMVDGYVSACDDIINRLNELKGELK